MKTRPVGLVLILAACMTLLSGCLGLSPGMGLGADSGTVSGAVKIITPSPDAIGPVPMSLGPRFSLRRAPSASYLNDLWSVDPTYEYAVEFSPGLDQARIEAIAARLGLIYEREGAYGFHILSDPQRREPRQLLRLLETTPGVLIAEENGRLVPLAIGEDPYLVDQWALEAIRAQEAWERLAEVGDLEEIVVAVIDTGIDFSHPDLDSAELWVDGKDFTNKESKGIDYGYRNFTPDQAHPHGTGVAGVIGALSGNGAGIRGVAPNVKMMPLRVFSFDSKGTLRTSSDVVARAIEYAIDNGAHVINLSLGDNQSAAKCSLQYGRAIDHAVSAGVIVVAAAGNTGGAAIACPANLPGVIAVGSIDRTLAKAAHSSTGSELDLVAPGGERPGSCIIAPTVVPSNAGPGASPMQCDVGTSYAAPHVSGVVAMMLGSGFPQDPGKVQALLHMTAIRPDNQPGWDGEIGYGRLDALGAVSAGIPRIMVAEKSMEGLIVRRDSEAGVGGYYRIHAVPQGTWTVVGWVDVDGDGSISPGDYFAESGSVVLKGGQSLIGVDLILQPYEGDSLFIG